VPSSFSSVAEVDVIVSVDSPDVTIVGDRDVLEGTTNSFPVDSAEGLGSEFFDVSHSFSVSEDSAVMGHSAGSKESLNVSEMEASSVCGEGMSSGNSSKVLSVSES